MNYGVGVLEKPIYYDIHLSGTLNVLDAARGRRVRAAGIPSTVGVLGLGRTREGRPADETCYTDIAHLFGPYK